MQKAQVSFYLLPNFFSSFSLRTVGFLFGGDEETMYHGRGAFKGPMAGKRSAIREPWICVILGKVLCFFQHQFPHLSVDVLPVWTSYNLMPHIPGRTADFQQMVNCDTLC